MRLFALYFIACVASSAAFGQSLPVQPAAPSSMDTCFSVETPRIEMPPNAPLLVNRCTGSTWMLVRTNLNDAAGKPTGVYTWRWSPLAANTGEAQLVTASP